MSGPEARLRPLAAADLVRVAELEVELFGAGAWSPATLAQELAAPDRVYLAAEAGGEVVGYAGIALAGDGEVMTIGVAPAWRRRGIGTGLLGALLAAARTAGLRRVFLEVRAEAEEPQRLYRRFGFRPVGLRRGYYQPENADAVVMRLDLTEAGPEEAGRR